MTNASFDKTSIAVKTFDGLNIVTLEPFTFTDPATQQQITVPAGTHSDGPSIPRGMWVDLPPFGLYWLPAVLHDYLYRCTDVPKALCDTLFYNAMIANGVPPLRAGEIYNGVKFFGWKSFENDRAFAGLAGSKLSKFLEMNCESVLVPQEDPVTAAQSELPVRKVSL